MDLDHGPFWLSLSEYNKTKFDVVNDRSFVRKKTKAELFIESNTKGHDTTSKRYLKTELEELCNGYNIEASTTTKEIVPGWLHKSKGMLQVLYKRGFINTELVTKPSKMRYSKSGWKDNMNIETGEIKTYFFTDTFINKFL